MVLSFGLYPIPLFISVTSRVDNTFLPLVSCIITILNNFCRYENCLSVLKKLVELRQEDARVTHNKAVAQYLLSNLTKTDEFRRTLEAVELQFEQDAGGRSDSASPMSVTEKAVLLFNKALIHQRVCYYNYMYVLLLQ